VAGRYYTLSEMALKTAVPHRLLLFWVDNQLLRPEGSAEHPGRGTARVFSRSEMMIASLLWPLAVAGGMPIGFLKGYALVFRWALGVPDLVALGGEDPPQLRPVGGAVLDREKVRRVLDRAASGVGANFFVCAVATDGRATYGLVTDEEGPPKLDLVGFYPEGFPRGQALTTVISLTERLAPLFTSTVNISC
jgi:hypothetical protein